MTDRGGLLVTFEGGEGSGKSTQVAAMAERARGMREIVVCREPGSTALGERLREALYAGDEAPSAHAELFVFAAARAQLVHELIAPAIERGALVLCDRFADSTVAYQQFGRGLDATLVAAVNAAATGRVTPDLTVLLDGDPQSAMKRAENANYMEREQLAFHERVRAGYLELARAEPARWLVVDGERPVDDVSDSIWARIRTLL